MMSYGWAILIIVIVAAALWSFGVFSPSSSVSTTITGFSGLGSAQALCAANGVFRLQLGNSLGQIINVTEINATVNGVVKITRPNATISPQSTYAFSIGGLCPSVGSRYSISATVTYKDIGTAFSGPYFSSGTVSGTVSSKTFPTIVAFFNGINQYISANVNNLPIQNKSRTLTAWFYSTNLSKSGSYGIVEYNGYGGNCVPNGIEQAFEIYIGGITGQVIVNPWCANLGIGYDPKPVWTFAAYEINGSPSPQIETWQTGYLGYINGTVLKTTQGPDNISTLNTNNILIAYNNGLSFLFKGYIADVKIYNTSLSQAQIQTLVNEGIGGNPVQTSNLVAWYPLNGSVISYVANNNAGSSSNGVVFTSNYPST